jgi:hypothetical protein
MSSFRRDVIAACLQGTSSVPMVHKKCLRDKKARKTTATMHTRYAAVYPPHEMSIDMLRTGKR